MQWDKKYLSKFNKKNHPLPPLGRNIFNDCEFLKLFDKASLRSFICDIPEDMFPNLEKRLYSNLKYVGGIHTNELKRQEIKVSLEEFAEIFNLPYTGSKYKVDEDAGNS